MFIYTYIIYIYIFIFIWAVTTQTTITLSNISANKINLFKWDATKSQSFIPPHVISQFRTKKYQNVKNMSMNKYTQTIYLYLYTFYTCSSSLHQPPTSHSHGHISPGCSHSSLPNLPTQHLGPVKSRTLKNIQKTFVIWFQYLEVEVTNSIWVYFCWLIIWSTCDIYFCLLMFNHAYLYLCLLMIRMYLL